MLPADFFIMLVESGVKLIVKAIAFLIDFVAPAVDAIMVPVCDLLPSMGTGFGRIVEFLGFANTWVAIDHGLYLLMGYFVFVFIVCSVKWILGLIPTVN